MCPYCPHICLNCLPLPTQVSLLPLLKILLQNSKAFPLPTPPILLRQDPCDHGGTARTARVGSTGRAHTAITHLNITGFITVFLTISSICSHYVVTVLQKRTPALAPRLHCAMSAILHFWGLEVWAAQSNALNYKPTARLQTAKPPRQLGTQEGWC